jgi:hypothetical protein
MKSIVTLSSSSEKPFIIELDKKITNLSRDEFSDLYLKMHFMITEQKIITGRQRRFNERNKNI